MLEASGLTKDYGPNRAVDGVTFTIDTGDVVGLLGPNGSGKTTIMRMLTGFFGPTAGHCRVDGIDVSEDPVGARRRIGYLPERVSLYPDFSVRAYLTFVGRMRELGKRLPAHLDESMEAAGLTHMADRQIGKLSLGYRQRVGLAQAIIHQPAVLILDEPTAGLDPRQIVEIRALIRELAGRATVLMSTHILPEVSLTCRRVLILDHGRLIADDTAEGLSARTRGQGQTLVRVVGAGPDQLTDLVGGLEEVVSVEEASVGAGVVSLIAVAGHENAGGRIALAVAERGWRLIEISPAVMSLEDLFVEMLEKGGAGESR